MPHNAIPPRWLLKPLQPQNLTHGNESHHVPNSSKLQNPRIKTSSTLTSSSKWTIPQFDILWPSSVCENPSVLSKLQQQSRT